MNNLLETILKVSVGITGAIVGWMTVFRPLLESRKAKKVAKQTAIKNVIEDDKAYRKCVLGKLDEIENKLQGQDETLAIMQRGDIERAYCMFVVEHGYCPSGMKESIADVYGHYTAKGYNHIAKSRIEELLALPEFPNGRENSNVINR